MGAFRRVAPMNRVMMRSWRGLSQLLFALVVCLPMVQAESSQAAPQKCLVCCAFCGEAVCAANCRDARSGDDECEDAKWALRSALSAGQIGAFRGGQELGVGEALGGLEGMGCDAAMALAEKLTSWRRRPPETRRNDAGGNAGVGVANGVARVNNAQWAAAADPFEEVAKAVLNAPQDAFGMGAAPSRTNPKRPLPAQPDSAPEADPISKAIDEKDWLQVEKLAGESFTQLKDTQLGSDFGEVIKRLKGIQPIPDQDPMLDQAVVRAMVQSINEDLALSRGALPQRDLPPAVRASQESLAGPDGPSTSWRYAAAVIEAGAGQDPRPFMSPTAVDATGLAFDVAKAFGKGIFRPLSVAAPALPSVEVSAASGSWDLTYANPLGRAGGAFLQGGEAYLKAQDALSKAGKFAMNLSGAADAIEISNRLITPVGADRERTLDQLVRTTLEGLEREQEERGVEIASLRAALGSPSLKPSVRTAVEGRISALREEQREIARTRTQLLEALPTATTQSWGHLFRDTTPFMER